MKTTVINTLLETLNASAFETEYMNYITYLSDENEHGLEQPPLPGLDASCRYFIHEQDSLDVMLSALYLAPMHQVLLRYAKYMPFYNELATFLGSITVKDMGAYFKQNNEFFVSVVSQLAQYPTIMHWASQKESERNRILSKETNAFNDRTQYGLIGIYAKFKETFFFLHTTLFTNFGELYAISVLKDDVPAVPTQTVTDTTSESATNVSIDTIVTQATMSKTLTEYSNPLSGLSSSQDVAGAFDLPTDTQPTFTYTDNTSVSKAGVTPEPAVVASSEDKTTVAVPKEAIVAKEEVIVKEPPKERPANAAGDFNIFTFIIDMFSAVHHFFKDNFGSPQAILYWVLVAQLTLCNRPWRGLLLCVLTYLAILMFTKPSDNK